MSVISLATQTMATSPNSAVSVQKSGSGAASIASASPITSASATSSAIPAQDTSVTLGGRALMLARLFNTKDANAAPPVMSGVNGMDKDHVGMSPANFLTQSDRALVSNMYAFAQQQGADLQYVDQIAYALGNYRQTNDGRTMSNFNNGMHLDSPGGHVLTVGFSAQDTATVASIQNGNAINSTQLDHGFLSYLLDPGNGALSYAGDWEFMQQMVVKFSDEGAADMRLDPKFATYTPVAINDRAVFTASSEVASESWAPDYISIDGIGHWRTPELEAKYGGKGLSGSDPNVAITKVQTALKYNLLTAMLDQPSKSFTSKK